MPNDPVGMAVLGVAVIALLVGLAAAGFSHKTWPIYTIILAVLNIFAAAGFFYLAARTQRMDRNWGETVAKWEARFDAEQKRKQQLLLGGENEEGTIDESFSQVRGDLIIAEINRGRAWGVVPLSAPNPFKAAGLTLAPNGSVKLNVAVATLVAGEQPEPHGIEVGMILYAFKDRIKEVNDLAVAQASDYLGQFKADKVDPKLIELTRLDPALPQEILQLKNNTPLVLYETCPSDDRSLFKITAIVEGVEKQRNMTVDELKKHFGNLDAEILKEYAQDEMPAEELKLDPNSSPEQKWLVEQRTWWRLKFNEDYELEAKAVAAPPMANNAAADNAAGAAADPMNEGAAEPAADAAVVNPTRIAILKGETALIDPRTAADLIQKKIAVPDDKNEDGTAQPYKMYVRELRDYPLAYRLLRLERQRLEFEIAEVTRAQGIQANKNATLQATNELHQAEAAKLKADLEQLKNERAALKTYQEKLSQALVQLRGKEAELLQKIQADARQYTMLQLRAYEKMNRNSEPSTPVNPAGNPVPASTKAAETRSAQAAPRSGAAKLATVP